MTLTFRAFTDEEYVVYRAGATADYEAQMVELGGIDPEAARAKAEADMAELLPREGPKDSHTFVVGEEHRAPGRHRLDGSPARPGLRAVDLRLAVDEQHRGRGFGRELTHIIAHFCLPLGKRAGCRECRADRASIHRSPLV